jgi:NAD(P)-dependent dehydrogenase (short-subunit alcohol dehydrogenase family)
MDYGNRLVVVTGGTGALGTGVVGALLEVGAVCHVPYRSDSEAKRFPYADNKRVSLVPLRDLADEGAVREFYGGYDRLWASIHVAGGFAWSSIAGSDQALLMGQLMTNLVSAYVCSRAAIAAFARAGSGGRIVNVAARQALEPRLGANLTAYSAAKAGVAALTIALAEEVANDGVLVNAVAPSIMDTPANRASLPKAPFDTWPKVEEVAAAITFLASPDNRVVRGAVVPVYGKA